MKKKILDILIQIIPVMIGVYLGFVVTNWGEAQKKKSQTKIFLENVRIEMESNRQKLESVIDYHEMLRDSSRIYGRKRLAEVPNYFQGIRVQSLVESAYTTGNQTGIINELGLNNIQRLNQLYTSQGEYNEMIKMLLNSLITMDFSENEMAMKQILRFLSITMTDLVIKEEQLINEYTRVNGLLNEMH